MLRYAAAVNKQRVVAAVGAAGSAVLFTAVWLPQDTDDEFSEDTCDSPFQQMQKYNSDAFLGRPSKTMTEAAHPGFNLSPRLTRHPFISKEIPTRDEQLARLSSGQQEFDVLVIGGGATGSGVALDAQMRGLNTALIERADFSSETSSRSTKLVSSK